jgi:RNase P/RNase MRP subunit p29
MGTVGNFAFESFRNSKNALVITNNTSIAFITKEKIVMEVVKRKEQKVDGEKIFSEANLHMKGY